MEKYKIGVAIPTFNRNDYLLKLLDTIPENIQIYVSDNGSFVTEAIKEKYNRASFSSIHDVIPMYKNWNKAVSGLNSEWVCVASDDDLFQKGAFEKVEKIIDEYCDADVIIFGNDTIDENGNVLSFWLPPSTQLFNPPEGFFPSKYGVEAKMIGIFFKKNIFERVGGINEEYLITASDSHFVQKLLLDGKSIYVKDIISQYRVWGNNFTSQTMATKGWIDEVSYWQNKIAIELRKKGVSKINIKNYRDEVIARNLLGSLSIIRKQKTGIKPLLKFIRQFPYPFFANIKTQFYIFRCLLAAFVKG